MKYRCANCGGEADKWISYCPRCGETYCFVPVVVKASDYVLQGNSEPKSTAELIRDEMKYLPLTKEWSEIFGMLPDEPFCLLVYGEPGVGKTTFLLKLSDYLTRFGNVFFNAIEENTGPTMIEKLKRLEIIKKNLFVGCQTDLVNILNFIMDKKIKFLVIDPINLVNLTTNEIGKMMNDYDMAVLMTCHVTKELNPKGDSSWLHFVDVLAEIKQDRIILRKNRFGKIREVNYAI